MTGYKVVVRHGEGHSLFYVVRFKGEDDFQIVKSYRNRADAENHVSRLQWRDAKRRTPRRRFSRL